MLKYLNRGISTQIALTIIIVLAVVLVGGVFAYQYYYLPKQEKETEIFKVEISEDETADWKTHGNEEIGYEIKYPPNWYLLQEPDSFDYCKTIDKNCLQAISIQNVEESLIGLGDPYDNRDIKWFDIKIFETNASSLEKWIHQSDYSDIYKQEMLNSIISMKIGKIEKRVWREEIIDMIDMMFVHKGKRYTIRYTSHDVLKDQNIVRNVLSTFRFIDLIKPI